MTDSLSRLIALPFALVLIVIFTTGSVEEFGLQTMLVLISLTVLMLLYIFNKQIDIWYWRRRPPALEKPLKSWLKLHSKHYREIPETERDEFERRIATLNRIKNFTLKEKRDFELEEDVKTIISHEFVRLTKKWPQFLYDEFENIVVYNHPFGTPKINDVHTLELYRDDGVIIFSKEQLINGFLDSDKFLNIGLLAAIQAFITAKPRLNYPEVASLSPEEICEAHGINLSPIHAALGTDWINRLDLLILCFFLHPEKTKQKYPQRYEKLNNLFLL